MSLCYHERVNWKAHLLAAAVGILALAIVLWPKDRTDSDGNVRGESARVGKPPAPVDPELWDITPPPEIKKTTLPKEIEWIRIRAGEIRNGPQEKDVQRIWIRNAVHSRRKVFEGLLGENSEIPDRFLTDILNESDDDLRLPLAMLLRTVSTSIRSRLLVLAGPEQGERTRLVALAALGSSSDMNAHALLDAAARTGSDAVRETALDSLGHQPSRYDSWGGRGHVEETVRAVVEGEAGADVRIAAYGAYVRVIPSSRERSDWLRSRREREPDPRVRSVIDAVLRREAPKR